MDKKKNTLPFGQVPLLRPNNMREGISFKVIKGFMLTMHDFSGY